MRKIASILISSLLAAVSCSGASIEIEPGKAKEIHISSEPTVLDFNFFVKNVNLIIDDDKKIKIKTLDKGLVLIPSDNKVAAAIVITNEKGKSYMLRIKSDGNESVFHVADPLYAYEGKKAKKIKFESGKVEKDVRRIVKAVLNNKKLSGFELYPFEANVKTDEVKLVRTKRLIGGKYIVDLWDLKNISGKSLYFEEEDFYTKGVLAVAIGKNRLLNKEKTFLIIVLNKASMVDKE